MSALFHPVTAIPLEGHQEHLRTLNLAEEVPVRLIFNELLPYGVMMLTPAQWEDFAYGYCLTENIVTSTDEIHNVQLSSDTRLEDEDEGLTLSITIAGEAFSRLLRRRPRSQTGQSSCGLCGTDEVPSPEMLTRTTLPTGPAVSLSALQHALHTLEQWQELNAQTHMVHAAAWADLTGKIHLIREDIGRHNALDKLIGALCRANIPSSEGICVLTSRFSYEMSLKTLRARMPIVMAISAPTSRALRLSQRGNQTLIAIARPQQQWVFCGAERIAHSQA